jgi:SAM-dependent methyltransferase
MKNLDYITADIESPLAKVKMDVHQIPFDADTFDVCFCNHVMEHVDDDIRAMSEIRRVLKPGGWAIIQSPIDYKIEKSFSDPTATTPALREKIYGQNDHVRQYGRDYKQILEKAGFRVDENDFVKKMSPELVKRYGLDPNEYIYVCYK